MNFCGIISEFNPFHNGHKFIIEKAKEKTNCDIVCVMSGNFVQRGEAAFQDKFTRAENAIKNGATAVLELPTIYACSNAENFAFGAIKILKAIGAKFIAFGVENANIEILEKIAKLKFENSIEFQNSFKNEIENGINFNTALKRAIVKNIGEDVTKILEKPNNVLAIEYLTAIYKLNAKIKPVAIERSDFGFNSKNENNEFLSAGSIRERFFEGKNISKFIPKNAKIDCIFNEKSKNTLKTLQILKIKQTPEKQLSKLYDYNEGIEFRIKKCAQLGSFEEIKNNIVSPRYRENRVNKLMLYPLLEISKHIENLARHTKPFAKVLAIDKNNKNLLKTSKTKINLVSCTNDYNRLSSAQQKIIQIDLNSSEIYNTICGNCLKNDKTKGTLFL
ncbi:MAG: nucleotidyltransferase family protein [Clostridia bacterium]|nr:nucleotidyltransferase family protein [Clostridia bacterium]